MAIENVSANLCKTLALTATLLLTGLPFRAVLSREPIETGSIKNVSALIASDPKNADLYLKRARLQATYLNFPESVADATRSIAIKPTSVAYFTRGQAYREMGALPKAIADLEKGRGKPRKIALAS